MSPRHRLGAGILLCVSLLLPGGCPDFDDLEDLLEDIELEIDAAVAPIQTQDPRFVPLPQPLVDSGDTVIINNNVTVVNDISEQLVYEELPDITLLGFENLVGLDAYYRYLVDGELQEVFVFAGETLLLEYPCLNDVELISEDYFDFDGFFVEGFDLSGAFFENPFDFECGDAFIITFTPDDISIDVERIDLLD